MKKLLFPLVCLMFVFSSCKKYEDGPGFSLRSKTARVAGEWKVEKQIENGQDLPLTPDDKDDTWVFKKDGTYEIQDPGNSTESGTWVFDSKKENIIISEKSFGISITMKILRLTNKEMWLEYSFGTDKSELHLMQ
ncbi:MAG: lipocalin family protein [Bacteroidota bacterium]|nr:lipocalin family protein [Bacteroidota bacterium]